MKLIPEIVWPHRNTKRMTIHLHGAALFYSYETLIGALIPGKGMYSRKNDWGPTTGRHMKELGLNYAKVVSEEELAELVHDHAIEYFQDQLREKFVCPF